MSCANTIFDIVIIVSPSCHNRKLTANHDYFIPKRCCQLHCWWLHPSLVQMERITIQTYIPGATALPFSVHTPFSDLSKTFEYEPTPVSKFYNVHAKAIKCKIILYTTRNDSDTIPYNFIFYCFTDYLKW